MLYLKLGLFLVLLIICIIMLPFCNSLIMKARKDLDKKYKERDSIRCERRFTEGNYKEKGIINKIDELIDTSNLKKFIPFISSEIFIGINLLLIICGYIIGDKIFGYWVAGIGIGIGLVTILYIVIKTLQNYYYKKIDNNLMMFINTVSSFATTTDDILTIFKRTAPFLNEPLKGYIEEFCNEATNTGDITSAFRKLENKLKNKKAESLIRNLELCSSKEADYRIIIDDSRRSIKEYLKGVSEKEQIVRNGRIELSMCLIMGIIMIIVFMNLVPNLLTLLISDFIGNIVTLIAIIILIITIWNFISLNKKE